MERVLSNIYKWKKYCLLIVCFFLQIQAGFIFNEGTNSWIKAYDICQIKYKGKLVDATNEVHDRGRSLNNSFWTGKYIQFSSWIQKHGCLRLSANTDTTRNKTTTAGDCQVLFPQCKFFGIKESGCVSLKEDNIAANSIYLTNYCNSTRTQSEKDVLTVYSKADKAEIIDSDQHKSCVRIKCHSNETYKYSAEICSEKHKALCSNGSYSANCKTWNEAEEYCMSTNLTLALMANSRERLSSGCRYIPHDQFFWIGVFREVLTHGFKYTQTSPLICQAVIYNPEKQNASYIWTSDCSNQSYNYVCKSEDQTSIPYETTTLPHASTYTDQSILQQTDRNVTYDYNSYLTTRNTLLTHLPSTSILDINTDVTKVRETTTVPQTTVTNMLGKKILNNGTTTGIAVGSVLFIGILVFAIIFAFRKRKRSIKKKEKGLRPSSIKQISKKTCEDRNIYMPQTKSVPKKQRKQLTNPEYFETETLEIENKNLKQKNISRSVETLKAEENNEYSFAEVLKDKQLHTTSNEIKVYVNDSFSDALDTEDIYVENDANQYDCINAKRAKVINKQNQQAIYDHTFQEHAEDTYDSTKRDFIHYNDYGYSDTFQANQYSSLNSVAK